MIAPATCGVMRSLERRPTREPGADRDAGERADRAHLERGVGVEVGQQPRQPRGEHRLARTRRSEQEDVVTAGRGDLHGLHRIPIADDVGEIALRRRRPRRPPSAGSARPGSARARLRARSPPPAGSRSRPRGCRARAMPRPRCPSERVPSRSPHAPPRAPRAAPRAADAADRRVPARRGAERDRPTPPAACRSATSTASAMPRSNPDPCFGKRRRREIDDDPTVREAQPGVDDRRPHPGACLAERRIRKPDDSDVRAARSRRPPRSRPPPRRARAARPRGHVRRPLRTPP